MNDLGKRERGRKKKAAKMTKRKAGKEAEGKEQKKHEKHCGRSRTTDLRSNIMQGGYIEAASHSIKEMQMTQRSWKNGAELGRWRSTACSR